MGILKTIGSALSSASGIGSLLTAGSSIVSSLFGKSSQEKANETNLKIAQMNNEWSERMMEKQNQYDIDMWNRNNEYNSASAQVQRLKEAGLNPALFMGSGAAGQSSGGSSVGLPSPSSATMQPINYQGFANSITNAISASLAISKNNSEIHNANKNTDAQVALARAKIAELYEETSSKKFQNELNKITRDLQISNMNEDYLKKVQERSNMEQQAKLVRQQTLAQELVNQNLPDKLAMEVAVMASQRDLNDFNSSIQVGKFMDELKKRGIKLNPTWEKIIFGALMAGQAFK